MIYKPGIRTPLICRRDALRMGIGLAAIASSDRISAATHRDPGPRLEGAWRDQQFSAVSYLHLPVRINDVPVQAMIDSGASRTVAGRDITAELALRYLGPARAMTMTREVDGSLYRVKDLQLEVVDLHDLDIASYDLSHVERLSGRKIPLIIGQDVLRKVDVEIQFPKSRARFLSPHAAQDRADSSRMELQESAGPHPALTVRIEDAMQHQAIVDFGDDLPLSMSRDFAEAHGLLHDRPVSTTMTYGVEGASIDQIICLRRMQIGPFVLHQVPACIVSQWKPPEPLSLGWPFFTSFNTIMSFGSGFIGLRDRTGRSGAPFPKDRSGLGGQRHRDSILILHVASNSPASRAGLVSGDAIVAINGRPIDSSYPAPGKRFGLGAAGTSLRLKI